VNANPNKVFGKQHITPEHFNEAASGKS
jgi:hypothetical protein